MKRRIFSTITALALIWSLCPTWAFAAEADPALCPHHPEHTAECGCIAPSGAENSAYQPQADTELSGAPCTYVCNLCPIEDLISALPDEVTADNADDVQARLDEILALYRELTEEEQDQLDLSRCYELQEALDAASAPALVEGENTGVVYGLLNFDAAVTQVSPDTGPGYTWDAAAKTLTLENFHQEYNVGTGNAIVVPPGSTIFFKGTNTIEVEGTINGAIYVASGGDALTIDCEPGSTFELLSGNLRYGLVYVPIRVGLVKGSGIPAGVTLDSVDDGNMAYRVLTDGDGNILSSIAPEAKIERENQADVYVISLKNAFAGQYEGAAVTVLRDVTSDTIYVSKAFRVDLAGHTITCGDRFMWLGNGADVAVSGGGSVDAVLYAFEVTGGTLTLESGTFRGMYGVYVDGGTLVVTAGAGVLLEGADNNPIREPFGLYYNSGAVHLSGGTMKGNVNESGRGDILDFLEEGYVYRHLNKIYSHDNRFLIVNSGTFAVEPCASHNWSYEKNQDGHTAICSHCKEKGATEGHQLVNGICTVCGYVDASAVIATVTSDGSLTNYASFEDAWTAAQNAPSATLTLHRSTNISRVTLSSGDVTLEMDDNVTLSGSHDTGLIAIDGGTLTVKSGSIVNNATKSNSYVFSVKGRLNFAGGTARGTTAIRCDGSGVVNITGGTLESTIRLTDFGVTGYCLHTGAGFTGSVSISGGIFNGQNGICRDDGKPVSGLLAPGCAYKDMGTKKWCDSTAIQASNLTVSKGVVVIDGTYQSGYFLTVEALVKITAQPQDTGTTYGTAPTLSIAAQADGTVTYAWYLDGEAVPDAAESTFTPSGLTAGEHTVYCMVGCEGCPVSLQSETATVTVGKRSITASVEGRAEKTYDGTTDYNGTPPAIRLDGLVSGDSVTAYATAWTFNSADVVGANSVTASGITLSGPDAGNYILASDTASGTGVITKSQPTITFNDTYQPDKTYDGQPIANPAESDLTIIGAAYSDVAFTWYKDSVADANRLTAAPTDAGSYVVVATIPETANTKSASGESGTVTISQAAGSVSITGNPSKTYDGSAVSAPAYTKSGTGTVTVEYSAADGSYTATAPSDAGSYTVRITVAADNNYAAASDTKDFTITARTAGIAWSGTDLTYNGSTQVPVATVSNKVSGDDVSVTVTGGQTNAGTYTATADALTGAAAKNYQLPSTKSTASFTIGKATPTVTNVTVSSPATLYESTDISTITLTHGAGDTAGTVTLVSGQTLTNGTKEYSWTFTPDDTDNYETTTGQVSLTVTEDALKSIEITTQPTKTIYTYGESFDKTDMVVTATYVSGATKDVTNEVEIRPTTLTVDTSEVTIAYGGQTAAQAITVNPKTVSDPVITLEYSTHEYTGSALVPSVVVKDGNSTIDPKEYTVTYSNNVEIGTATVTITDNPGGNYAVSGSATFTITAKPVTGASISVSGQFTYTGAAHTPEPTVTLGGNTLAKDTDYTVSYANNTDAGTASVTITGMGNYTGTKTASFAIDPATLTAEGKGIAKGTYGDTLSGLTVEGLTAKLSGNTVGGTWKLSGDTIPDVGDAGEYTATFTPATGAGNYETLTAKVKLEIAQADYTGTKSASTSAKFGTTATYDLTALLPEGATAGTASTASDIFEGTPAVSGKDLSYTLKADAAPDSTGTITVPVTSANYKAFDLTITVTVTEKDVPELTVSEITVTYSGKAVPASAIKGTATVDGKAVSGTWSFAEGQAVTNVADSGVKTVKFTPNDSGEYMEAECTVKVTINKATPSGAPKYTAISASGKTLADAGLTTEGGTFSIPGTVAWELADDTEVTAGASYQWIFTPDDADNYNTLSGSVVLWRRSTGGGGYVPSTPGTGSNLPVSTGTAQGSTVTTAVPTASTQGNTAVAKVDTAMGQEIVKQAMANNSESVVIAPKITGSVTRTEVSLPASTVGQIGSQTNASLTISTPVAGVTIPNGGLASLSGAGGTVTVSAEMQGSTVELSVTANGRTVEHIPGGVTLTVPMANTTPGTVAVLVHPNGTQETVRKSVAHNGSVTIPLDGSAKLVIVDNGRQFIDVPATSWAADAVAFASAHELFNGTGGGMFSPDAAMSRGMLAVVLHNLENNPDQPLTGIFADVDNSQWYAEGIAWAAANGIVGGYGNGQFGPNDPITREQLAVMLWRYAGSPAATNKELHFTDADEISDYALNALRWAVENGILNGYGNGQLRPGGHATRAETAQMLKNFMESQ